MATYPIVRDLGRDFLDSVVCECLLVLYVDVCSFMRHRWPSRLVEDGRWWLRFPSVFSEDEMMWTMIVGPLAWQRMGDGGFAFPLYSVSMKRCGLWSLALQDGRGWAMVALLSLYIQWGWNDVDYDHWSSRLAKDGQWWLCFPFVFSEDETMFSDNVV